MAAVIGAFLAAGPLVAVDFTVSSTADAVDVAPGDGVCATAAASCTLRAAVMEANALAGADRVLLAAVTYQLTLIGAGDGAGDLDLASSLEIAGVAGTTITTAAGLDRVMEVSAGAATVHDVTLRALGAAANPTCVLASAPLVATNLRCEPALFSDGFESGNLASWSVSSP